MRSLSQRFKMAQPYDLPIEQLRAYLPALTREQDFVEFWQASLQRLAAEPLEYSLTAIAYPVDGVQVYDLTFRGFGGSLVHAWYAVPERAGPHPGLVVYHGYNWSFEGAIDDMVNWALHGYATLGMHVRGQYASEDKGPDPHGHVAGWMTKGILDKESYYYRYVYLDAVRAVEVLASFAEVDSNYIGVSGRSQGGGVSIAAAALSHRVKLVVAEYPYLSHFRRAIDLAPSGPYLEINEFFRRNADPEIEQRAMRTLSYVDVMNLAPWVTCPILVSIGLIDEITPPSTVFAAFNHLASVSKELKIFRYFGHEPMPRFQLEKLTFLKAHLKQ